MQAVASPFHAPATDQLARGGIACRDDTGWKIEREMGLDGAQGTEFRQAGSEMDLMIAAHALAEDSVVITNNAREFHRVPGLAVEAWTIEG